MLQPRGGVVGDVKLIVALVGREHMRRLGVTTRKSSPNMNERSQIEAAIAREEEAAIAREESDTWRRFRES